MNFTALDSLILHDIEHGFPGAQLCISLKGKIIKNQGYGYINKPQPSIKNTALPPITEETYFDIASLTKIFSIVYGFQYLSQYCSSQKLIHTLNPQFIPFDLNIKLIDIFKPHTDYFELRQQQNIKSQLTLAHCLSHKAGFPSNPIYYDSKTAGDLYFQSTHKSINKNRRLFLNTLLSTPLEYPPNTKHVYSDPDFMLLTCALEIITGQRVDDFIKNHIFLPNNISNILYQPLKNGIKPINIAPTELFGNTRDHSIDFQNVRTQMIHGEVQDEKAFHCMNEISGHAGLFATALGVVSALNLMTKHSYTPSFFNTDIHDIFLKPNPLDPSFGQGWRLNTVDHMNFTFGDYASPAAFGHTGWTGCVMIHDPKYELTIAYLTNRKNTIVVNPKINPHQFEGDLFSAGIYKNIINEVYRTLHFDNASQLKSNHDKRPSD